MPQTPPDASKSKCLLDSASRSMASPSSQPCRPVCALLSSRLRWVCLLVPFFSGLDVHRVEIHIPRISIMILCRHLHIAAHIQDLQLTSTGHLERVGIAWPNPMMFDNPLLTDIQTNKYGLGGVSSGLHSVTHRRNDSNDSATESSPMRGRVIVVANEFSRCFNWLMMSLRYCFACWQSKHSEKLRRLAQAGN